MHSKEFNPKSSKEIPSYAIQRLYAAMLAYKVSIVSAVGKSFYITVDENYYGPYQKIRVGPFFTSENPNKDCMFKERLDLRAPDSKMADAPREPTGGESKRNETSRARMSTKSERRKNKEDRKDKERAQARIEAEKPFYVPIKTFVDITKI
jgi:hypothetical protein